MKDVGGIVKIGGNARRLGRFIRTGIGYGRFNVYYQIMDSSLSSIFYESEKVLNFT